MGVRGPLPPAEPLAWPQGQSPGLAYSFDLSTMSVMGPRDFSPLSTMCA